MIPGSGIFRTKLPLGFKAGGINCGVRLYRPDLGVIISEQEAVASAVFTLNHFKAAPIKYCQECLPSHKIRAIITNSGEANAATGEQGIIDNLSMAEALAIALDCETKQVLTASTGVIGRAMSIDKITKAIPELIKKTSDIAEKFATAILTTDLVPKAVYKDVVLSSGEVRITGICKGSGMIHPNMATMLGYLLSDVRLDDPNEAQKLLRDVCDQSFNMISVDGETSTNDCVFFMANGASQHGLENENDKTLFYEAMRDVAITLAKSIACDGEGATKLIEANIEGAETDVQARAVAKSIITSPLIKTAVYGESPNWGRIIARIGNEAISEYMLDHCEISIQDIPLFKDGAPMEGDGLDALRKQLGQEEIKIQVRFVAGSASATAWGCDLTEQYVKINAEYVS